MNIFGNHPKLSEFIQQFSEVVSLRTVLEIQVHVTRRGKSHAGIL